MALIRRSPGYALAIAMLLSGCPDDATPGVTNFAGGDGVTASQMGDSTGFDPTTGEQAGSGDGGSTAAEPGTTASHDDDDDDDDDDATGSSTGSDESSGDGISSTGSSARCGNDVIKDDEVCDGSEINEEGCIANGTPGCDDPACQASVCAADPFCCDTQWDATCANGAATLCPQCASCAHPICTTGVALTSGCDPCVTSVCGADPFCCSTSWDSVCVGEVTSICGIPCP